MSAGSSKPKTRPWANSRDQRYDSEAEARERLQFEDDVRRLATD